jgi:hypothetical protein
MVKNRWDVNSTYFLPEFYTGWLSLKNPQLKRVAAQHWRMVAGGRSMEHDLRQNASQAENGPWNKWLPSVWYASDRPQVGAFAVPVSDEGMVQLNIRDRNSYGRVQPGGMPAVTPYDVGLTLLDFAAVNLPNHIDGRSVLREGKTQVEQPLFPEFNPRVDAQRAPIPSRRQSQTKWKIPNLSPGAAR